MIALVDAKRDDNPEPPRGGGDRLGRWPWHHDRMLVEADVLRAGQDRRGDEGEIRVPGDEGLRKNRELRPLACGLGQRGEHAIERARLAVEVGGDLNRGDADDVPFSHHCLRRFETRELKGSTYRG